MSVEIRFVTVCMHAEGMASAAVSGWKHNQGIGLFDSYVSALADSMGLWEEYCAYHRSRSA